MEASRHRGQGRRKALARPSAPASHQWPPGPRWCLHPARPCARPRPRLRRGEWRGHAVAQLPRTRPPMQRWHRRRARLHCRGRWAARQARAAAEASPRLQQPRPWARTSGRGGLARQVLFAYEAHGACRVRGVRGRLPRRLRGDWERSASAEWAPSAAWAALVLCSPPAPVHLADVAWRRSRQAGDSTAARMAFLAGESPRSPPALGVPQPLQPRPKAQPASLQSGRPACRLPAAAAAV